MNIYIKFLCLLSILLCLLLNACSLPEWLGGTAEPAEEKLPDPKPGEFPNLSKVPLKGPRIPSKEQRAKLEKGLVSDRSNARYVPNTSRSINAPSNTINDDSVPLAAPVEKVSVEKVQPQTPTQTTAPVSTSSSPSATPQTPQPQLPGPSLEQIGVIYFTDNSTKLSKEANSLLNKLATQYKNNTSKIRVVGYAGTTKANVTQSEIANNKIALERAQSVINQFIKLGIAAERMESEAVNIKTNKNTESAGRKAEIFLKIN
ncbi:MAG: OmpA family protein [Alphaproteobacteria bacterium]|nr:OmpA family protein [Alphaproteobacteria bacterium]